MLGHGGQWAAMVEEPVGDRMAEEGPEGCG